MARPSSFKQATADIICERIAKGESLRAICEDDDLPDRGTVIKWLAKTEHAEFHNQYARAREIQADSLFDEILDIADENDGDSWTDENGVERTNHDVIARSRLRVDARKWMAGKLQPKKYGDKVDLTVTNKAQALVDLTDNALADLATGRGAGVAAQAGRSPKLN